MGTSKNEFSELKFRSVIFRVQFLCILSACIYCLLSIYKFIRVSIYLFQLVLCFFLLVATSGCFRIHFFYRILYVPLCFADIFSHSVLFVLHLLVAWCLNFNIREKITHDRSERTNVKTSHDREMNAHSKNDCVH